MQISLALLFASLLVLKRAASAAALLTLTSLVYILALCVLSAGLAWFLQTASGPSMIFRPWRKFIFYRFWFKGRPRRVRYDIMMQTAEHSISVDQLEAPDYYNHLGNWITPSYVVRTTWQPAKWWRILYKPLGGCIYCNAPYVLIPYFFGLTLGLLGWPFWLAAAVLPLAIGGQYAVIELLNDYAK